MLEQLKVAKAVERLEKNLPLRHNQGLLPPELRQLHQSILRFYLKHGKAPGMIDYDNVKAWKSGVDRLASERIIVLDQSGNIIGAYPFVSEDREFRVISEHGTVNAMCAFDALAISSMFNLPTRIESRCRLSAQNILIHQNAAELAIIEPDSPLFAAINWDATDSVKSCSASLCTEMMFIAGESNARQWQGEDPVNRELFNLDEAHALICAVFMPLME